MKINDFNATKARVLNSLIAFKWIKVEKYNSKKLDLYIPNSVIDGGGEGRLGHHFTCEVLAIGPKVSEIKVGDRFLIHEYDKEDQATAWNEDDVMFCDEKVIKLKLNKDDNVFIQAKQITDKMADEYENY